MLLRLDTLMRRSRSGEESLPPSSETEEIPVLTEVYQPDQDTQATSLLVTGTTSAEQMLDAVAPLLADVLDEVLREKLIPALVAAVHGGVETLRPQLEDGLRQALVRALESRVD
ncbi:MAG: hypothetical protein N2Z69_08590 [Methylophilaceae bacterium]|nr:hypothetical protein [Methylophilaceae bacterium]